jgi:hypothetical protein
MGRFNRSHNTYRCGGYGSYTGHCGAGDCETCHPGGAAQMRAEEAREEWEQENLAPLHDEHDALEKVIKAAHELQLDTTILEARLDALENHISEMEDEGPSFDDDGDYDAEPDYDEDYEADRAADAYEDRIYG